MLDLLNKKGRFPLETSEEEIYKVGCGGMNL
jgi:hypothetical protein